MLVREQDELSQYLKDEFENAGSELLKSCFDLRRILLTMLEILKHGTIYLVVDALDECDSGLSQLLNLITDNRFVPPSRVKWLITS